MGTEVAEEDMRNTPGTARYSSVGEFSVGTRTYQGESLVTRLYCRSCMG